MVDRKRAELEVALGESLSHANIVRTIAHAAHVLEDGGGGSTGGKGRGFGAIATALESCSSVASFLKGGDVNFFCPGIEGEEAGEGGPEEEELDQLLSPRRSSSRTFSAGMDGGASRTKDEEGSSMPSRMNTGGSSSGKGGLAPPRVPPPSSLTVAPVGGGKVNWAPSAVAPPAILEDVEERHSQVQLPLLQMQQPSPVANIKHGTAPANAFMPPGCDVVLPSTAFLEGATFSNDGRAAPGAWGAATMPPYRTSTSCSVATILAAAASLGGATGGSRSAGGGGNNGSFDDAAAGEKFPLVLRLYMAMEYLDGGSLKDAVDKGLLRLRCSPKAGPDVRAVLETAVEIASAIEHLHKNDVVHGDLSAVNVLLKKAVAPRKGGRRWMAKVCDFGLSLRLEPGLEMAR